MLCLLRELARSDGIIECPLPAACEPLHHAQGPQEHHPTVLIAALEHPGPYLLEDGAGAVGLAPPHQPTREHVAGAVIPLALQPEPLFELDTALEEARGDVGKVVLGQPYPCDRRGDPAHIAGPLGLLQRRTCVGERRPDVAIEQVRAGAKGKDTSEAGIVTGLGERAIAELDLPPGPASLRHGELEENVGSLHARRRLLE